MGVLYGIYVTLVFAAGIVVWETGNLLTIPFIIVGLFLVFGLLCAGFHGSPLSLVLAVPVAGILPVLGWEASDVIAAYQFDPNHFLFSEDESLFLPWLDRHTLFVIRLWLFCGLATALWIVGFGLRLLVVRHRGLSKERSPFVRWRAGHLFALTCGVLLLSVFSLYFVHWWDTYTHLYRAAEDGNNEEFRRFVNAKPHLGNYSVFGQTPVDFAVARGNDDVAVLMMVRGVKPSCTPVEGYTALGWAVARGNAGLCRDLLETGVYVDKGTVLGGTPLWLAVHYGHADVVRVLLEYGADANIPDGWGVKPVVRARLKKRMDIVELLEKYEALKDEGDAPSP